jgi:hypothetical protein
MSPEDNPTTVPLHCGQDIVLLTCWLEKVKLLFDVEFIRKYLQHTLHEISAVKETVFNAVSLSLATMTRRF